MNYYDECYLTYLELSEDSKKIAKSLQEEFNKLASQSNHPRNELFEKYILEKLSILIVSQTVTLQQLKNIFGEENG